MCRKQKRSHSICSVVIVRNSVYRDRRRRMVSDRLSRSQYRTIYIQIVELIETEAVRFVFSTCCSANSEVIPLRLRN